MPHEKIIHPTLSVNRSTHAVPRVGDHERIAELAHDRQQVTKSDYARPGRVQAGRGIISLRRNRRDVA